MAEQDNDVITFGQQVNRRGFFRNAAAVSLAGSMLAGCRGGQEDSRAPAVVRGNGRKRNIVFILVDDLRFDAMSCRGHPVLQTPNIDRLARQGLLFENAFVTTSLCSPSRATILTGLYAHRHRILDNRTDLPADIPNFPVNLHQAGYRTGFVGKWHMGGSNDKPRPGFDRWVSFAGQGVYFDPLFNIDGESVQRQDYVTDLITEYALDFIERSKNEPFFLYMSHKAVHDNFSPAPRHKGRYAGIQVPHPASMADIEENYRGKPDWLKNTRKSCIGVDAMYDNRYDFDQFYKDYCETVLGVDDSVGVLLDKLEREGLLEDTLVMFMGDNGFLCGEHGLIDKRNMYEPSIRIPLIAHCPLFVSPGSRCENLALNIDIAPTILDATGAEPMPGVHGKSLLDLIEGRDVPDWRRQFLYEYLWERDYPQTPTVQGLRTEQYSYMRYQGVWDINELYDIQTDPDQMNNLLGDVRITTQVEQKYGSTRSINIYNSQIEDSALRDLVFELEAMMFEIIETTGGMSEPSW